jgi:hypothetical protein
MRIRTASSVEPHVRLKAVVLLCLVTSLALACRGGAASLHVSRTNAGLNDLTPQGRLLFNFESILRANFPHASVVVWARIVRSGLLNFHCTRPCGSLSQELSYQFVFRRTGRSAFHLSRRKFNPGYFGNYPEILLIRGRSIACDRKETKFLIRYRSAVSFTLGCL